MRALLRRRPPRGSAPLAVGDLTLNPDTHEVLRGERSIELTQREFELLEYLMRNERIVISRQRLLDEVWGYDPFSTTNTIEVFVSNLRRKLESDGEPGSCTRSAARATSSARSLQDSARRAGARLSGSFDRLPIRVRLAGVSALLTFVILCGFAVAIGSLRSTGSARTSTAGRRSGEGAAVGDRRSPVRAVHGQRHPPGRLALPSDHAVIRVLDARPGK